MSLQHEITHDLIYNRFDECVHCIGNGLLKVILIHYSNDGKRRVGVFNYRDPEMQMNFLRENGNFGAQAVLMPCVCRRGDRVNEKIQTTGESIYWLTGEQRRLIMSRAVKYNRDDGKEIYYQNEAVKKLNLLNQGIDYKIKPVNESTPIEELIEKFKLEMSKWATA